MPKTLLLVDDDAMLRKTLADIFSSEGIDVRTAVNGADALRMVEGGLAFDVLLTDKDMPEMKGDALIVALRRRGLRQLMIIMTGDVRAAPSYDGADLVLPKPFPSIVALIGLIKEARLPAETA
jgi:two-component system, cell cycle sensor histidine kinase and response regulator CckA